MLAAAEAALTFTIGPIARVLVAEAAGVAASAADLTGRLAQHVRQPEDAACFRRQTLAAISGRKPPTV